jgi:steroid 5-alpha reductase family enzyme
MEWTIYTQYALAILGFMTAMFVLAQILKDNGIVDIGWGIGFNVAALSVAWSMEEKSIPLIVMLLMIALWGFRLSGHIWLRNRGRGEDFRYANWRREWGKWIYIRGFFQIFMLQGFFMWVISLPVMHQLQSGPMEVSFWHYAGLLVWGIGYYFEAVGDYQMLVFKRNPEHKGKIITTGLWRYTRHPNYFGEVVMWWGMFIFSIPAGMVLISAISPIVITWLILKVSGIPMLEEKYKNRKDFQEYAAKTPAFFPKFRA